MSRVRRPGRATRAALLAVLGLCLGGAPLPAGHAAQEGPPAMLPGTQPLTAQGDLAAQMVAGIHAFLLDELAASPGRREAHWTRDASSEAAYARSVEPNRDRLRHIIGAVDLRPPASPPELVATTKTPALVGQGDGFGIYAVRWAVLEGVDAEGLLLKPTQPPVARIVALPDADWTPEMLVGVAPGVPPEAQFARRLAENGCEVLVPTLVDRRDDWAGHPSIRWTNQPHREFVYRMAFEMGRHIIGYEVQKVLAAVDWLAWERAEDGAPIGVCGYGEGGLLALYSAAVDTRVQAALVSGYFQSRQNVWEEPIYRNVWALLDEFGDAEIAGLIAPRPLIIEACRGPEVEGPPAPREGRSGAAPGRLVTPPLASVWEEARRAGSLYQELGARPNLRVVVSGDGTGPPGTEEALTGLLAGLAARAPEGTSGGISIQGGVQPTTRLRPLGAAPVGQRPGFDPDVRARRQFEQLCALTQGLLHRSADVRQRFFWDQLDTTSLEGYQASTQRLRDYFWDEVIGRFPPASVPANPRTRLAHGQPKWIGYEVVLDVWPRVFAYGILLVPRDLQPGEPRPVVVCQHGLEGRPQDVVGPAVEGPYQAFAAQLADRGFIVYAPQNPYIGEDDFRVLQRMANPLGKSLFSVIVRQHERTLEWLSSLPFVDPERIGFYGLSYGGKTAMRVPALLPQYCLSICSGDFNEWVAKNASWDHPVSYMFTGEWEIFGEWDLGHKFNHAEMAYLIFPRPFMVERGHHDGVGIDEWVAAEYAKVRRLYAALGIPDRTEIEFFDGDHRINGQGTFAFLHRQLRWAERR